MGEKVRTAVAKQIAAIAIAIVALVGCATLVEGTDQVVTVQLSPDHASCDVIQKGLLITSVTGGTSSITIPKSKDDIRFECAADGHNSRHLSMVSSASGWGVIGCVLIDLCITDYSTGALNKYPSSITINLSKS